MHCIIPSPVGRLRITATEGGISSVTRTDGELAPPQTPLLTECVRQLNAYFSGQLTDFDLPLHMEGTAFRLKRRARGQWDQRRSHPSSKIRRVFSTASSRSLDRGIFPTPATKWWHRSEGISTLAAGLLATARAIRGVISPSMASAMTMRLPTTST